MLQVQRKRIVTDPPEDPIISPPPLVRMPEQSQADDVSATGVTPADVEASRLLRGLFTNRIFIQPDGLHLRINLGEIVGGNAVYHTAIVVPNADALQFGELLVRMARESIEYENRLRDALKLTDK